VEGEREEIEVSVRPSGQNWNRTRHLAADFRTAYNNSSQLWERNETMKRKTSEMMIMIKREKRHNKNRGNGK